MSDYIKSKVIRKKVSEDFGKKYIFDKLPDNFKIEITVDYIGKNYDTQYFLDKVLYSKYGANPNDYGFVRKLTKEEITEHLPSFNDIMPTNKEELKYVEYCYYIFSECRSYFDEEGMFSGDDN